MGSSKGRAGIDRGEGAMETSHFLGARRIAFGLAFSLVSSKDRIVLLST